MNPVLVVDAVVFTVQKGVLKILLIRRKKDPFKTKLALPGGKVEDGETFREAAIRELQEESGVKNIFLKQFGVYDDPKRDPRGRYISVAFIAIISPDYLFAAGTEVESVDWISCDNLPTLAFDHKKIIADALVELRFEIQTTNIAYQLLPNTFTMTDIQLVYEQVLGKTFDRRNFVKRIKALDILKLSGGTKMDGAHRPAYLYKFKSSVYQPLQERIHIFL